MPRGACLDIYVWWPKLNRLGEKVTQYKSNVLHFVLEVQPFLIVEGQMTLKWYTKKSFSRADHLLDRS